MSNLQSQFTSILTAVGWPGEVTSPISTIGLTSCEARQGVSHVAAEMALSAAQSLATRTLLVDCNFVNPSVHKRFHIPLSPGLGEALLSVEAADELIQQHGEYLRVLPAGRPDAGWTTDALPELLDAFRICYELIVLDIPQAGSHPVADLALQSLDRLVVVVDAKTTKSLQLERCSQMLTGRGIQVSGVVMNRSRV